MRHQLIRIAGATLLQAAAGPAWACRVCRPRVQAGIHNAEYSANLLLLLLPVALLLGLGLALYFAPALKRRFSSSAAYD